MGGVCSQTRHASLGKWRAGPGLKFSKFVHGPGSCFLRAWPMFYVFVFCNFDSFRLKNKGNERSARGLVPVRA